MTDAERLELPEQLAPAAYIELHNALDEPASDRLLSARDREIRDRARAVVATDVVQRAHEIDRSGEFPMEGLRALARAGLAGLLFPEDLGGSDHSNVAYAAMLEEVAAACPSTSLVLMTQMHAGYPIMLSGSRKLQEQYVPGLLDLSRLGSLAITEPDAGSDVASLKTRVHLNLEGGTYRLRGGKTFITSGDRADVIICFATVDRTMGRRGITAFVLDASWRGISSGAPFGKLGMHGSSTAELFFEDVTVPVDHRLGDEGDGWSLVMQSVTKSRISAAAQGVGIARGAYARTLLALRVLHGRPLPPALGAEMAELRARILQGRLLLYATAREIQGGTASAGQVGMMKQACTDLGFETAVRCLRLLGPYGDLKYVGVERFLRDAKVTQIYDGTNEIQRLLVARENDRLLEEHG